MGGRGGTTESDVVSLCMLKNLINDFGMQAPPTPSSSVVEFRGDRRTKTITLPLAHGCQGISQSLSWGVSHVFMEHLQKTLESVLSEWMGCPT